jgi:transcriptional regulator with XRE-family HTH domain
MTRVQAADVGDEKFQGLLLQCRGRTGLTQRELAARLGVHMRSVDHVPALLENEVA